ncbi:MAG: ComEC/Rec2 family competence protein [Bdellovibrionales bacterium]|nr:ComEC/Rec2 family competence protein [Bdellovibrionales bacterium]
MAPHHSSFQDLYQALICGHKISNFELKEQIRSLGLLHLFVVSGTHLHFISLFIEGVFKKNKTLTYLILVFYSFSCGLKAPVVRALTSRVVKHLSHKYKLGYSPSQSLFFSFLLLAPIYGANHSFVSLVLSSLASLIVEATSKSFQSEFFRHLALFLLLSIVFLPLQTLHPITFLFTYFMTPLICYIFIPLSLTSFFYNPLTMLTDQLWSFVFNSFNLLQQYIPNYRALYMPIHLSFFLILMFVSYFNILRSQK